MDIEELAKAARANSHRLINDLLAIIENKNLAPLLTPGERNSIVQIQQAVLSRSDEFVRQINVHSRNHS